MLRHGVRHAEYSVKIWLEEQLLALGWLEPAEIDRPFRAGLTTVNIGLTGRLDDLSGKLITGSATPVIGLSIAGNDPDEEVELGGATVEVGYDLFLDAIAAPRGILLALVEDLNDLLSGRSISPAVPFHDASTGVLVPGETLELSEVGWGFNRNNRDDWVLFSARLTRTANRSWA
jgi:hypothetical protein